MAARADEQKIERARTRALEQLLAARRDEQKAPAQERARSQALEQLLAARRDDQQLLSQERARNRELEQLLAACQDHQKRWPRSALATRRSSSCWRCTGTSWTVAARPRQARRIDLP